VIDIPGYSIKREIGAGGMASVHLAVQTSLDREVALKVMSPALAADPTFSKRFLQEARMLASLAHPNIVAVYDVGVTSGQLHYFSMQYLPGGDFGARVRHGIDERELTQALAGVARALGYAHQRGYVHRDVAPGNILYDANGNPVLTDFGIALAAASGSRITSAGFSVGTSHYMSPEQARGGDVDLRSDIYSLGVLCYYGLTGKPPYDGQDGFAVAYAHVFEPIPRLPADFAHWQPLVDRALAKDAKHRYANTDEFLDAMALVVPQYAMLFREEADESRPVTLTPPPPAPAPSSAATVVAMPAVPQQPPAGETGEATTRPMKILTPPDVVTNPRNQRMPAITPPPAPPPPVQTKAKAPAGRNLARAWPLLIVLLGVVLIGVALFSRMGRRAPDAVALPAVVEQPAPTPPVPAATTNTTPATDASTAPANTATAPADAATTASTVPTSPSTATPPPTTAMDSIDAAEAASANANANANGDNNAIDPGDLPTVVDPVTEAIRLGRLDLAGQRLTTPPGSNALERFQLALKLDPKNKAAKQGVADIAKKYIDFADKNLSTGDMVQFGQFLDRAGDVAKSVPDNTDLANDIATRRQKAAEPYLAQAKTAATAWDKAAAKTAYEKALQVDPNNAAAREGLKTVGSIGEPGFVFRDKLTDGAQGPELVVVDAQMAMARRDVTRAEFRRYWAAAGRAAFEGKEPSCRDRESIFRSSKKRNWENPDIVQDDTHPVVCIGWQEAAAYAQWLSKQTGKRYHLPSPAEFDRVARRAPAGDCKANLADASFKRQFDSRQGSDCDDGFAATSPVGHFEPVAGVFDIDGNVRQWAAACGGGAAAEPGSNCRDFIVKGRGWLSQSKEPATFSDTYASDVGLNTVGFRVVRDLEK
jgi:serine/threonine-protein kinase PpkA